MRPARAFIVPYDSAQRAKRMGAGPLRIAGMLNGIPSELIESTASFPAEIQTTFELYRKLAAGVRSAVDRDEFPVVLSGNCGACVGTAAGLGGDDLAVIWFDAHGDFMTPETSTSGYLDGMGMAILAGLCWTRLASSIPCFAAIPAGRLINVGARDFSEGEEDALAAAGVALITAPAIREHGLGIVSTALDAIAKRAKRILVHVDMDVIDPQFGAANHFAAPGGLSPDEVRDIVAACAARFEIAAVGIASFDPSYDDRGTIADAAVAIVKSARG